MIGSYGSLRKEVLYHLTGLNAGSEFEANSRYQILVVFDPSTHSLKGPKRPTTCN